MQIPFAVFIYAKCSTRSVRWAAEEEIIEGRRSNDLCVWLQRRGLSRWCFWRLTTRSTGFQFLLCPNLQRRTHESISLYFILKLFEINFTRAQSGVKIWTNTATFLVEFNQNNVILMGNVSMNFQVKLLQTRLFAISTQLVTYFAEDVELLSNFVNVCKRTKDKKTIHVLNAQKLYPVIKIVNR